MIQLASFQDLPTQQVIVFHHIPRTGGAALSERLHRVRGKKHIGVFGFSTTPNRQQIEYCQTTAGQLILHGHNMLGADEEIGAHWPYFTMLRDPYERFVSEFFLNYSDVPDSVRSEPHCAFEDFVNSLSFASYQTLLLAHSTRRLPNESATIQPGRRPTTDDDSRLLDLALNTISTSIFAIGCLEECGALVSRLQQLLDVEIPPAAITNARPRDPGFSLDNVPVAKSRLDDLLSLDMRLYEMVRSGPPSGRRQKSRREFAARKGESESFRIATKLGRLEPFDYIHNANKSPRWSDRKLQSYGDKHLLQYDGYFEIDLQTPLPVVLSCQICHFVDAFQGSVAVSVAGHSLTTWDVDRPGLYSVVVPAGLFSAAEPTGINLQTVIAYDPDARPIRIKGVLEAFRVDPLPIAPIGKDLSFGVGRSANVHVVSGAGPARATFIWSQGSEGRIAVALDPALTANGPAMIRIELQVVPFVVPDAVSTQRLIVRQRGDILLNVELAAPQAVVLFAAATGSILELDLEYPNAMTGKAAGIDLDDVNAMAIALESMRLDVLPRLEAGATGSFGSGSDFTVGMVSGWKPPETGFVWANHHEAQFVIALGEFDGDAVIGFHLSPLIGGACPVRAIEVELEPIAATRAAAETAAPIMQEGQRRPSTVTDVFSLESAGWGSLALPASVFSGRLVRVTLRSPTSSLKALGLGDSDYPLSFQLLSAELRRVEDRRTGKDDARR